MSAAAPGDTGGRPRAAEHYVSSAPFDPYSIETLSEEQERYFLASQWRMMWWRLKRHRLAVVSGAILVLLYLMVVFAEIIAPYGVHSRNVEYVYAPPQTVRWFHDGAFVGPFVYDYDVVLDLENLARVYTENEALAPRDALLLPGRVVPALGRSSPRASTSYVRPRAGSCSCSEPTGSGATCFRVSSTARGSPSPSASSASRSAS